MYKLDQKRMLFGLSANFIFITLVFGFSYVFSVAYQYGDQISYRGFYAALSSASFDEISQLQLFYTGSSEPVSGLISWLGAQITANKDAYYSIINSLLCFALLRYLLANSANNFYIVLVFLNYYIFVLLGPAERLKNAFFFTILAMVVPSVLTRFSLLIFALFSHFQMFLLFGAWFASLVPRISLKLICKKRNLLVILFILIVLVYLIPWFMTNFSHALIQKYESYQGTHGILSILNISLLAIIAIGILDKKVEALFALILTAIAAILVGHERINMVAFVIFSLFVIKERKTGHPLVLAMMMYFVVKGMMFVTNVFLYGTGF